MMLDSYLALAVAPIAFGLPADLPHAGTMLVRKNVLAVVDGLVSVTQKAWMLPLEAYEDQDGVER